MATGHGIFAFFLITLTIFISNTQAFNLPVKQTINTNMIRQFLAPHNAARSVARLPPLVWDPKLAQYAESYARQRQTDCALMHSNGPYGENIFWGSGNGWTPSQAVMAWVEEKRAYRYGSNSCARSQQCGHYTQVMWKSTKKVGCAQVICSAGRGMFMICNYDPPGNFIGEKPY